MNIEKTIKQRFRRAVRAAQRILSYQEGSTKVIELNNHVFHLEAIRPKEIWCRNKNGKFVIQII